MRWDGNWGVRIANPKPYSRINGFEVTSVFVDEYEDLVVMSYLPEIVKIAKAFQEVSYKQAFPTEWPLQSAVWMKDKQAYRRKPIDSGVWLRPMSVKVGKKAGLIFMCAPDSIGNVQPVDWEYCELTWREVCDAMPEMFKAIVAHMNKGDMPPTEDWPSYFKGLNDIIVASFADNAAMLKATQEGLVRALEARREWVEGLEQEQEHPAFGMF